MFAALAPLLARVMASQAPRIAAAQGLGSAVRGLGPELADIGRTMGPPMMSSLRQGEPLAAAQFGRRGVGLGAEALGNAVGPRLPSQLGTLGGVASDLAPSMAAYPAGNIPAGFLADRLAGDPEDPNTNQLAHMGLQMGLNPANVMLGGFGLPGKLARRIPAMDSARSLGPKVMGMGLETNPAATSSVSQMLIDILGKTQGAEDFITAGNKRALGTVGGAFKDFLGDLPRRAGSAGAAASAHARVRMPGER